MASTTRTSDFGDAVASATGAARRAVIARFGSQLDVDDVVQEAVARALRSQDRFDHSRPVEPWLVTIALRIGLDVVRRSREIPTSPDALDRPAHHSSAAPSHRLDRAELARAVEATFEELRPGDQRLLRARYELDQSDQDIAAEDGRTIGATRTAMMRARDRFRARFDERGVPTRLGALLGSLGRAGHRVRRAVPIPDDWAPAGAALACAVLALAVGVGAELRSTDQPGLAPVSLGDGRSEAPSVRPQVTPGSHVDGPTDVVSRSRPSSGSPSAEGPVRVGVGVGRTSTRFGTSDEVLVDPDQSGPADPAGTDGTITLECVDPSSPVAVGCAAIALIDRLDPEGTEA